MPLSNQVLLEPFRLPTVPLRGKWKPRGSPVSRARSFPDMRSRFDSALSRPRPSSCSRSNSGPSLRKYFRPWTSSSRIGSRTWCDTPSECATTIRSASQNGKAQIVCRTGVAACQFLAGIYADTVAIRPSSAAELPQLVPCGLAAFAGGIMMGVRESLVAPAIWMPIIIRLKNSIPPLLAAPSFGV